MKSKNKGFRSGDIIVPISNVTQSNYWELKHLKRVRVILVNDGYSTIQVEVVEGDAYDRTHDKRARRLQIIWVNDYAFELQTSKVDDYGIF